jgi:NAD(P) transhydrogenase subunit alpha
MIPRISRAQAMDVLSSQSNLAGYKAVVDAVAAYGRAVPMMMTAAGTIRPAKILVIGAGVAGLQAIATARRMGAIVSAFDVRAVAKEQVQSLGATFVEVPSDESGETAGGYAKEMSEDYKKRQMEKLAEVVRQQDIIITTALIPGKPAPILITTDMLKSMKLGSIVFDLAIENGGNCEGAEFGKTVTKHGVQIIGTANVPSQIAFDASQLFARNILNFLKILTGKEGTPEATTLALNFDDEILKGSCLTHNGQIVHSQFQQTEGEKSAKKPAVKKTADKATAKEQIPEEPIIEQQAQKGEG